MKFLTLGLPIFLLAGLPIFQRGPAPEPPTNLPPGLEYTHIVKPDSPWSIHVLRLELGREDYRLESTVAHDRVFGLEQTSRQAGGEAEPDWEPVAAVNGDFFVIAPGPYQGDMSGLQIAEGELVSAAGRDSFWIDPDGRPRIGKVRSELRLATKRGPLQLGLNRERGDDRAVLYTPRMGGATRTTGGEEWILRPAEEGDAWLPLKPGARLRARVAETRTGGNTPIPADALVLSLGPELVARYPVPEGIVEIEMEMTPALEGVQTAIGGWPVLLKDGLATSDTQLVRHPRTAVGFNADSLYFVAVDGRQPRLSVGMTFAELGQVMRELGCTDAMNLDGGGSTTMWIGGSVVNSPSDGRERAVANALVLLRRRVGAAEEDGVSSPARALEPAA